MSVAEVASVSPVPPPPVRYIKLGPGNRWAARALQQGELHLGHDEVPHELALRDDAEAVIRHLVGQGRSPTKAKDFAREVADFYQLGPDAVWITFAKGKLWWAHADTGVEWIGEGTDHGTRIRRTLGPWRDTDARGNQLLTSQLSSRLTKVAAYRQTICAVEAAPYLLRKLAGENEPAVERAQAALSAAVVAAEDLIGLLHWSDFETLVEMFLSRGGWHRMSALGGTQQDVDMVAEQPTTGERAFVQVKSSATQGVLDDYIRRFDANPTYTRMFFACHNARGKLTAPDQDKVTLWTRRTLAEATLRHGLLDWLIARAA